jgi:hypothetical protein
VQRYVAVALENGAVAREGFLKCVCGNACVLREEQLHAALETTMYDKYQRFVEASAVGRDPNLFWCPSPVCGAIVTRRNVLQRRLRCNKCNQYFCVACGASHSLFAACNIAAEADFAEWVRRGRQHGDGVKRCPKVSRAIPVHT